MMTVKMLSLDLLKLQVKQIIKQIAFLSETDRKKALEFILECVQNLKNVIINSSKKAYLRRQLIKTNKKPVEHHQTSAKLNSSFLKPSLNTKRKHFSKESKISNIQNSNENIENLPGNVSQNCVNIKLKQEVCTSGDVTVYYENNLDIEENFDVENLKQEPNSNINQIGYEGRKERLRTIKNELNTENESDESNLDSETNICSSHNVLNSQQHEIVGNVLNPESTKKYPKGIDCFLCGVVFHNFYSLMQHLFDHPGSSLSCIKCKNTFKNISSFKLHVNADCLTYGKISPKILVQYITNTLEKMGKRMRDMLFCPYCGYRFSKLSNLRRHLKNVCSSPKPGIKLQDIIDKEEKYKCFKCNIGFPLRRLLKAHRQRHSQFQHKTYCCDACDKKFTNRNSFRNHKKTHSNDENPETKEKLKVWCEDCMISFCDEYTFNRHCSRKTHLENVLTNKEFLETKSYLCVECGGKFLTQEGLKSHTIRSHSNKVTLSCDKCDYKTTCRGNMRRHINCVHLKSIYKKFACDRCPTMFLTSSAVKDHINSVHCEVKIFQCDVCPKSFKLKSQLTRHKTIHSPALPYSCSHCSMAFKRRAHLTRHTEAKHKEHLPKDQVLEMNKPDLMQKMPNKDNKFEQMPATVITSNASSLHTDKVFSLIDAQSGELVTLSATELSKNAVINMSDGQLLNEVHMPELWNHPTTIYSLDPTLQDAVVAPAEYNIITHESQEISHVLQKTLENQVPKDPIHYCMSQTAENNLGHPMMSEINNINQIHSKLEVPPYMNVYIYENPGP